MRHIAYPSAFKRLLPYVSIFLAIQMVVRVSLWGRSAYALGSLGYSILPIVARGLWLDIVACSFALIPICIIYTLVASIALSQRASNVVEFVLRTLFVFVLLFDAIAEHLFWTEFGVRYNFIAVDYLVYTHEVVRNIIESYPVYYIISGIGGLALLISYTTLRIWKPQITTTHYKSKLKGNLYALTLLLIISVSFHAISDIEQARSSEGDDLSKEIAANGFYSLFYAFGNNEIEYDKFYLTLSPRVASSKLDHISAHNSSQSDATFTYAITSDKPEIHKNVIIVLMESMSSEFMGWFGNQSGLTPNLDKIASQGLMFSQIYAAGTRTVRGLEAIVLSLPPTPGQSILRRPKNHDLFTIGSVFRARGYDTMFAYGGYGYFDNMNAFFAANHFRVLDRANLKSDEITFSNAWGVADEDLFNRVIKEADNGASCHKPFLYIVTTTSNHRPFTYPDGKIDIASKSGRSGGVKYADYSIGQFIQQAQSRAWFKDTIFVFVADHTAGSGGKRELNLENYHIPMIFYAPGFINPAVYKGLASQIDLAPSLLGLMNFSYKSKFYGIDLLQSAKIKASDALNTKPHLARAFISNYQKIGLVAGNILTVLSPHKLYHQYTCPDINPIMKENIDRALLEDTIAAYQSASWWRQTYLDINKN